MSKSRERIRACLAKMAERGQKMTVRSVIDECGGSATTVSDELKRLKESSPENPEIAALRLAVDVERAKTRHAESRAEYWKSLLVKALLES